MRTPHRSRRLERQYLNVTGEAERRRRSGRCGRSVKDHRGPFAPPPACRSPVPGACWAAWESTRGGRNRQEDAGGDLRSQQGLWAGQQIVGAGEGLSEDRVMPGGDEQPRDVGVEETGLGGARTGYLPIAEVAARRHGPRHVNDLRGGGEEPPR